MRKHVGFTLVELMIVVAIIATLAAVAFPVYRGHLAKAQLAAALAEIRPGKTTIEYVVQESRDASLVTPEYIGLKSSRRCRSMAAELASSGVGVIKCTLSGGSEIDGKDIILRRAVTGAWSCDASAFEQRYRPQGCG